MFGSAVTGAVSGTVNQELPPVGPLQGVGVGSNRVPWHPLGSYTVTGTSLTIRIGTGPVELASNDYSVADGFAIQDVTENLVCTAVAGTATSNATWIPRAPNGSGDSIATGPVDMVIDQNLTLGQGSASYPAIHLPYSKTLTIGDGVTVVANGDVFQQMTSPTLTATTRVNAYYPLKIGTGTTGGPVLEFNGTATAWKITQSSTGQANAIIKAQGISGNRAIIRTNGANKALIGDRTFATMTGQIEADYTTFSGIGTASAPAIKSILGNSNTLRLVNCNFTGCGDSTVTVTSSAGATGTTINISDSTFESIVTSNTLPTALVAAGTGTGTFTFARNWYDGYVNYNFQGNHGSATFADNVYLAMMTYNNPTVNAASDQGGFYFKNGLIDNNLLYGMSGYIRDVYLLNDFTGGTEGNPHFVSSTGTNLTMDGCIWDYIGAHASDIGDAIDNGTVQVVVRNSIVLPSTDTTPASSGAFWQFSASNGKVTLEHNTIFCSNTILSGLQTAHTTSPGLAGQVPSVKSNIFWTTGSGVSAMRCDYPATVANDFITPAGILNNDFYGVATFADNTVNSVGSQSIRGMSGLKFSTAPASQLDANPQFVDSSRNFLKWARSARGKTGTNAQVRDLVLADIKADRTLPRLSLIPYVRDGYSPTNASLDGTAHDGNDVGAVNVTSAPSATIQIAGPTSGEVGRDSSDFTITVTGTVASPVTFSIGRANSTISPNTRTIGSNSSATFKVNSADYGDGTVIVTNDSVYPTLNAPYHAKIQAGVSIIGTPSAGMDWGGWLPNQTGHLSILNQDVTALPKDSRSDAIMAFWGTTFGSGKKINLDQLNQSYGRSYSIVTDDTPMVPVKVGIYKTESDCEQVTYIAYAPLLDNPGVGGYANVPTAPAPGDCHAIAFNRDSKKCYVLYDAWRDAGTNEWNCASFTVWDFSNGGGGYPVGSTPPLRPTATSIRRMGHTSETAAGLPVLSQTLRYDEAVRGPIQKSIRITTGTTGNAPNFVWPGRHYASGGSLQGLPFGARLRLRQTWYEANKAAFGETGAGPTHVAANILWGFRNRGVVSTDHTSPSVHFQIEAALSTGWANVPGLEALLETIPATGEAWEVVEMTPGATVSANRTSGYPGEPVILTATYNPAVLGDDNFGANWYFSTNNGNTIRTVNVVQSNTGIDPAHPGNTSTWTPQVSDIGTHQLTIRDIAGNLKTDPITYTVLNPQLDGGFPAGTKSGLINNPLIRSKLIK